MKRQLALMMAALLLVSMMTGCCVKHVPGPAATCTEPQMCMKCGKVLAEAQGHEYGPEATCTEPQVCLRCGKMMSPALGHAPGSAATCVKPQTCRFCGEILTPETSHNVGKDGVCVVCGQQITEPGVNYHPAGANGETGDKEEVLPETQAGGHYHNDISAFYAASVLICGDYGIEYFFPDETGSSAYAKIVNDFVKKYPQLEVTSLLVPKAAAYHTPEGYKNPHDNIAKFISATYDMMDQSVCTVDAMTEMDHHGDEYMFYRTDHHWTSLGAYYASVALCRAKGWETYSLDAYDTAIRTNMIGSFYSFSGGNAHLQENPDYTVIHYPHTGYSMKYQKVDGWYNGRAVTADYRDYASAYMSGDQALTVIRTDNHNGRSLLVFKESYANAFIPYLIDYYEQIIVVDIRYDTESTANLIEQYDVTEALFINNVQAALSLQSSLRSKAMS